VLVWVLRSEKDTMARAPLRSEKDTMARASLSLTTQELQSATWNWIWNEFSGIKIKYLL